MITVEKKWAAYRKIIKVIASCKTLEQIHTCINWLKRIDLNDRELSNEMHLQYLDKSTQLSRQEKV